MIELKGKTALISGGAEGIGFGIAQEMANQGMNIVLTDINADELKKAEMALTKQGASVLALPLDVADSAQWQDVTQKTIERFGKLHMLVNNAGVGGMATPVDKGCEKDWRWVVDVNLMGVVNGVHSAVPLMKQHDEGSWVINVASMAGFHCLPGAGPYSATKAAVVAMSEVWHAELQDSNIHVSVLCPGFVKTRINLSHRNKQAQYQSGSDDTAPNDQATQQMQAIIDAGASPQVIASRVVEAIEAKELYIITHPNYVAGVQARFSLIEDAFKRAATSPVLREILDLEIPNLG